MTFLIKIIKLKKSTNTQTKQYKVQIFNTSTIYCQGLQGIHNIVYIIIAHNHDFEKL